MLNGIPTQIFASTTTGNARFVLVSHSIGEWVKPTSERTWLTMPLLGSNISRRTMPGDHAGEQPGYEDEGPQEAAQREPLGEEKGHHEADPELHHQGADHEDRRVGDHDPGRAGFSTATR